MRFMKIINMPILVGMALVLAFSAVGMEKEQPSKRQRTGDAEQYDEQKIVEIISLVKELDSSRIVSDLQRLRSLIPRMELCDGYLNVPFSDATTQIVRADNKHTSFKEGDSFLTFFLRLVKQECYPGYGRFTKKVWSELSPAFIECLRRAAITSQLQPIFIQAIEQSYYEFMDIMLTIDENLLDTRFDGGKIPFSVLEQRIAQKEKTLKNNPRLKSTQELLEKDREVLKSLQKVYKERECRRAKEAHEFGDIQVNRILTRMNNVNSTDAINFILSLDRK